MYGSCHESLRNARRAPIRHEKPAEFPPPGSARRLARGPEPFTKHIGGEKARKSGHTFPRHALKIINDFIWIYNRIRKTQQFEIIE